MARIPQEPRSPCCHHCGFRDSCCLHCFRTLDEVRTWKRMSVEEKLRVMDQAELRRLAAAVLAS